MEVRETDDYAKWFDGLKDRQARVRILERVRWITLGNLGDVKPDGQSVSELRIDYGPGYRVYFSQGASDPASRWRQTYTGPRHHENLFAGRKFVE